jgi:hypothetical protein
MTELNMNVSRAGLHLFVILVVLLTLLVFPDVTNRSSLFALQDVIALFHLH